MRKNTALIVVFVGVLLMLLAVQGATAFSNPEQHNASLLVDVGDDEDSDASPEVFIPEKYQPQGASAAQEQNVAEIFFTPQDNNNNTTVLFLYNTDTVAHTASVETFTVDGLTVIPSTDIVLPPGGLVRICGDVVNFPGSSWDETVLVNFRDNSAYGKLSLPQGVKVEGYVAWNNGTTYDPQVDQNTLPLRFSTDPASVFLPTIQNND